MGRKRNSFVSARRLGGAVWVRRSWTCLLAAFAALAAVCRARPAGLASARCRGALEASEEGMMSMRPQTTIRQTRWCDAVKQDSLVNFGLRLRRCLSQGLAGRCPREEEA